jgi:hypothetical protein
LQRHLFGIKALPFHIDKSRATMTRISLSPARRPILPAKPKQKALSYAQSNYNSPMRCCITMSLYCAMKLCFIEPPTGTSVGEALEKGDYCVLVEGRIIPAILQRKAFAR